MLTKPLSWLESQHEAMVETLLSWSLINSGTYNLDGLSEQKDAIIKVYEDIADNIEVLPVAPELRLNDDGTESEIPLGDALRIDINPTASKKILLMGHMDTVFPKESAFQTPVWLDDNTLNGPGVADMKGGLIVMLYAIKALLRSDYKNDLGLTVLVNADEEIGSRASSPHIAKLAPEYDLGLDFEPTVDTRGTLAGQRKGSGKFSVLVKGKPAHAGRAFYDGRSAVVALAKWIDKVHALNGQCEGVTINVGHIAGGGALNVVPDTAVARLDIRLEKAEDERWIEDSLKRITEEISSEDGITATLKGFFGRKPKLLTGDTLRLFEWVKTLGEELGQPISWQATGGCCDGNNLNAAGLPNIDTLGVIGGKIHSPDEFVLVDSLTKRAQLTARILMGYARGDWQREETLNGRSIHSSCESSRSG